MGKIYSVAEVEIIANEVFSKNNIIRAYLFGSYAYGYPDEDSDIDIAV